jgi:hypothetical protein
MCGPVHVSEAIAKVINILKNTKIPGQAYKYYCYNNGLNR